MLALAARPLGYRIHVLSPEADSPTAAVADRERIAAYDDLDAVRDFASQVDVVTFEFENVPAAAADTAAAVTLVRPAGEALHITQNRLREKTWLREHGFPVPPFQELPAGAHLRAAASAWDLPVVVKTAGFGYDGKGQAVVRTAEDLQKAESLVAGAACIVESFVDFECELSVVIARDTAGRTADFGVFENRHRNHILDLTTYPAQIDPGTWHAALDLARSIVVALDYVGVLCVELFLTSEGDLLVNELAPRVHNSGHLTIDACLTSQFEQHVRAVTGLPLGPTDYRQPAAAMVNLLGDLWTSGEPHWENALAMAGVKLHLYGKREPRPGRKMGHLTTLAEDPQTAATLAQTARRSLLTG
jgi:5-(carboxyamino)imidazole ribonucleotide synthase